MSHKELLNCEAIGKRIREIRRKQRLMQAQLAGLANTGIRFASDLKNGK